MKPLLWSCLVFCSALCSFAAEPIKLSDGKSFAGWETNKMWRVEDGAFVGGSLTQKVPHNSFLCSIDSFTNFVLVAKFKLIGTNGFINGGVQIRSKHVAKPPYELSGYQADIGEGWWGALYDESRRDRVLVKPMPENVKKAIKRNEWNTYKIRAEGKHIQTWINDVPMIDYTETDDKIPQYGIIGLQVHGGGAAEAWYKDLTLEPLP